MKVTNLLGFALIVVYCVSAFGQTKESTAAQSPKVLSKQIVEKYKPIPLSTNLISGELQDSNSGKYHYYSFVAGRGEIILTVSLESTPRASANGFSFALYDNNEEILGYGVAMSIPSMPHQKVTRIYIPSQQPVLLRITEGANFGLGKYRIQIGGAVEFSQVNSTAESENLDPLVTATQASIRSDNKADYLEKCLPKKGTLIIKMRDGSKKIIDLSEAETVTIVP